MSIPVSSIDFRSVELQVLTHHIYEYRKGLRNLVLYTMSTDGLSKTEELLASKDICYFISHVNPTKVNVFFGDKVCIKIIKSFGDKQLSYYTDEEDFILGTMLGYDRIKQCERYIKRKNLQ